MTSVQGNLCHPFWAVELCVATSPLQASVVSSNKWESDAGCVVRSNEGTCLCTPSIMSHAVGEEMGRDVALPHRRAERAGPSPKPLLDPAKQLSPAGWL